MKDTATRKLFISFWDICLENLPEGTFRKWRLSPEEAKRCIDQARQANSLLCLTDDDLLAPYRESEKDNHDALCGVLNKHFRIALSLEDFVNKGEADGEPYYSINPLNCVQVAGDDRLMIITCAYVLAEKRKVAEFLFEIEPTTVAFHLIEAMPVGGSKETT